jgi:hypothetical protein
LVINKLRSKTPYGVVGSLKWFLCTTMLHCHCAYLLVLLSFILKLHLLFVNRANIKIKAIIKANVNIINNTLLR